MLSRTLSEAVPRYWFVDSPALQQFLTNELISGLQVAVEVAALATINCDVGNHDAGVRDKRAHCAAKEL